jgi:hypothetical protein
VGFFVYSFFQTRSRYASQAGLKLSVLLPQPPECWDYRQFVLLVFELVLALARQALYRLSHASSLFFCCSYFSNRVSPCMLSLAWTSFLLFPLPPSLGWQVSTTTPSLCCCSSNFVLEVRFMGGSTLFYTFVLGESTFKFFYFAKLLFTVPTVIKPQVPIHTLWTKQDVLNPAHFFPAS